MDFVTSAKINNKGVVFRISPEENKTRVRTDKDSILVAMNHLEFIAGWLKWQMKGQNIKEAFPTLTKKELDFLQTGQSNLKGKGNAKLQQH